MKIIISSSLVSFLMLSSAQAVINFTFDANDSTVDNGATVSSLLSGISLTVSNSLGNVDTYSGNGSSVDISFTDFIYDQNLTQSITFTFSEAVDVNSLAIEFVTQGNLNQENPLTLVAEANTGATSPITISDLDAHVYSFGFQGITSFTIQDNDPDITHFQMAYDNLSVTPVPEPSTFALIFALASFGLVLVRRGVRRNQ